MFITNTIIDLKITQVTLAYNTPMQPSVLVIGLGYVGLPVAALVASSGKYTVTGFDVDSTKIKAIQAKQPPWGDQQTLAHLKNAALTVTSRESDLKQYDYVLICVPTPVDNHDLPDLGPVMAATTTATQHVKPQGTIILESTVNPGVCEEVLVPLLNKAGLRVGKDVFLAHCPERIDPGNDQYPLSDIPRVLGADSPTGLKKASEFYTSFLAAPVKQVSSLKAAEASKIVENAFRDINIAFVNELAQSFTHFDLDVVEVIEAASTKPFGFMPHWPGCGVGGHCIPVDPYYLIESAQMKGFEHRFLKLAREINKGMPQYTIDLLEKGLAAQNLTPSKTTVGVLGIAYKAGIADQRNSPAVEIWNLLHQAEYNLERFDPYVPRLSTAAKLDDLQSNPDLTAIIIATNHQEFIQSLENEPWPHLKLIVDGRNCLRHWPKQAQYLGVGR